VICPLAHALPFADMMDMDAACATAGAWKGGNLAHVFALGRGRSHFATHIDLGEQWQDTDFCAP
jgi:hypothetical protein